MNTPLPSCVRRSGPTDQATRAPHRPKRRWAAVLVATLILAPAVLLGAVSAEAQKAPIRLGLLMPGPPSCYNPLSPSERALRRGLEEAGYVVGRNISIERRCFPHPEQASSLVTNLLSQNVDLIVVWSGPGALAVKRSGTTKPVVFIDAADPIGFGLITSWARPGGNATGIASISAEIAAKRMELLHEAVPKAKRIGILMNPKGPAAAQIDGVRAAARKLGLAVELLPASSAAELTDTFADIQHRHLDGLLVVADTFFFVQRQRIVELVEGVRLPAIYSHTRFVEAGGLMAYAAALRDESYRAAAYVDEIMRGAKPGDLPVEQPTKFDFVVNLKSAKALGLSLPESLLLQASRVIE
jgi:putative ABC transport system substrate-binding protein